jgi:hypothetical protein
MARTHAAPRTRDGFGAGTPLALAALALAVLAIHAGSVALPLVGDDYFFLEKSEHTSLPGLFAPVHLVSGFYRPWGRELHFALLHRAFGIAPLPFHLANLALTFAALALFWTWARRVAGGAAAAAAAAGLATLAPWQLANVWAACAQDLWMLVASMLALLSTRAGRGGLAALALTIALLSKETAAVLPGIAMAEALLLRREPLARALRLIAPMLVVLALWLAVHPLLGGVLGYGRALAAAQTAVTPAGPPLLERLWRTPAMALQLDAWPAPERGWAAAVLRALPGLALLGTFAWLAWANAHGAAATRGGASAPAPGPRAFALGLTWAACGWAPLAFPTIGWHAYYGLFGAFGVWLALGTLLARSRAATLVVIACTGVLAAAAADTPSQDWGTPWFQRRAAEFTGETHDELLRLHPAVPRGSRLFFTGVPSGIGLLPGGDDSPELRLWYGDPALRAAFLSRYRPRAAGDRAGRDFFFRYDADSGWVELAAPASAEASR